MSVVIVISLFVLAGIAFAVVELLARRENSTIPTLGDVSALVMEYQVGRKRVRRDCAGLDQLADRDRQFHDPFRPRIGCVRHFENAAPS